METFDQIVARNISKVCDPKFYDDITEETIPLEKKDTYRVFEFFIYEDSCEPDWIDFISSLHIQAYAIRHDKDIYLKADESRGIEAGQPKKVHWHVWLNWPGKKSGATVIQIAARCGGVRLAKKQSAIGSARYLTHMDEADKYRYDPNDVLVLGGSQSYTEYVLQGTDSLQDIVSEMEQYIIDFEITNYALFANYCSKNNRIWHDVLTSKRSLHFLTFIKSYSHYLQTEMQSGVQDQIIKQRIERRKAQVKRKKEESGKENQKSKTETQTDFEISKENQKK